MYNMCACMCVCARHLASVKLMEKMEESDVYNFMDGCDLCTDLDIFVNQCPGIMLE